MAYHDALNLRKLLGPILIMSHDVTDEGDGLSQGINEVLHKSYIPPRDLAHSWSANPFSFINRPRLHFNSIHWNLV